MNGTPPRLLVEERRRRVLEILESQERVTVPELVDRFGVSAVTIRSDLEALAEAGALVRAHGGALRRLDRPREIPLSVKAGLHRGEKARIGLRAAEMIRPEEVIILDSGTTTLEVARHIRLLGIAPITIVTNALNVAHELATLSHARIVMLGGVLHAASLSLVGPQTEQALKDLSADRLYLGVDGFDPRIGLTTPDPLEAELNARMIGAAREVVVVADSSKFRFRGLSRIAGIESVHTLITDSAAPAALLDSVRSRGIEVIVV